MIDLALDPSDTRPARAPDTQPGRVLNLRVVLFSVVGAGALVGFGVAATTLMAGIAAPQPAKIASSSRAADWPELKDGLPVVAGTNLPAAPAAKPAEPELPAPRMAALPDGMSAFTAPSKSAPAPAKVVAAPEAPTKRIPTPVPVALVAPGRQVVPLPPARTAALLPPRASETVRARELAEPAALPAAKPVASAPGAPAALLERTEKARKAAAARKIPAAAKIAENGKAASAVAQAEAPDAEETEVLGIKLPSLAPAGRKLKESVDALGDAVKKVF
ncbi:hypothetical protein [Methylobacterium sp. NEAU K]|uniref:hypothetical protein n=1 Tax=Methylobacterium sp. NEAU K TaxID=3064946 RepID=UPI002732F5DF|nr:hypothetical protein [Methylobacterium sp. NEAU K]MDP4005002.1 hypothetical protein [Methylobacterium sp. NEAU K]